jgi:hypothetical protein
MHYKLYKQMDKILYTPSRPDGRPADRFVGRSLGRLFREGSFFQVIIERVTHHRAHAAGAALHLIFEGEFLQGAELVGIPLKTAADELAATV